jgi:hypothetical protein
MQISHKMTASISSSVEAGAAVAATASVSSKATSLNSIGSSLSSSAGSIQDDAVLEARVTRVVNDVVFPKKQFIILERELDGTSKVACLCLAELRMEKDSWERIRNMVRKRLNRKRNNAQLCVRRSLHRK